MVLLEKLRALGTIEVSWLRYSTLAPLPFDILIAINLKPFCFQKRVTYICHMPCIPDSIAVSVFVDLVEFDKSETNPNNNLMMRQAGLSAQIQT